MMVKLSKEQEKVMLLVDDPDVDPKKVSMEVLGELIDLGLICRKGKKHLELTDAGEETIKSLQLIKP